MSHAGPSGQPLRFGVPGRENSPPDPGTTEDDRRKRAAIAAQACETCRTRKSKCDEKRPKCGLCERLGMTCIYREPQPTKKDKTLVEMMSVLNRIDAKVTMIGNNITSASGTIFSSALPQSSASTSSASASAVTSPLSGQALVQLQPATGPRREDTDLQSEKMHGKDSKTSKNAYRHLTPPHQLLMWPEILRYLKQYDGEIEDELQRIKSHGSAYFVKMELQKHPKLLSPHLSLESRPVHDEDRANPQEVRVEFPVVTYDRLMSLAEAYFMTFHCSHPAVDPVEFKNECLVTIQRRGFGLGCEDSVIVLMICALGEMAAEGTTGSRWKRYPNSGIRGGSLEKPPGLSFFNEARKRLGFIYSSNSLKSVQVLILIAVYYGACARHTDHYRTVMDACLAIRVVINTEQPIDWSTSRGNRIKILFHVCNTLENWFHFDLDMPSTHINELADTIPLPGGDSETYANEDEETVALHFLAASSLARVIARVQQGVYHELFTSELGLPYTGPPYQLLSELRRQLDNWRNLLPPALQWYDDDRLNFPLADERSRIRGSRMFSPLMENVANNIMTPSLDIMQAEMRARYYYVVMLINRPHLFKLIHFPDSVDVHDQTPVIQCVKACLLWPVALYPLKDKKRLVSYLYAWTTNFMAVLIILRLVLRPGPLRRMVEPYLMQDEVRVTVVAMLDWIKDMSQIDGTAAWAWRFLRLLYADVEMVVDSGILD